MNLEYIMDDVSQLDKETLIKLMRDRGFRKNKYGTRFRPSDKQIILAWDYVYKKGGWKEITQPKPTYRNIYVSAYSYKRGNKTVYIKKYKRRLRIHV